jgi:hypothetical protein
MKAVIDWKDQGFGNRKGGCKIAIVRNNQEVHHVTPFGTAEHHEQKQTEVFAGKDNHFVKHYQAGD